MQAIALQGAKYYPLDNTAIIHIATRNKTYSNIFRLEVNLTQKINVNQLQNALDNITPRFPTIVAGLKAVCSKYKVVPITAPLRVMREGSRLASFTEEEMNECALRVFYGEKTISAEFFHSLTDGHGGLVFLNTLVAEYLRLQYGLRYSDNSLTLNPFDKVDESEIRDDYSIFAKRGKSSLTYCSAYKLPGEKRKDNTIQTVTGVFDLNGLMSISHKYNTKLTTFLTTVMAEAIFELQNRYNDKRKKCKPIRIMIPVDLRRRYQSKTLRNFTLYVTPKIASDDYGLAFNSLIDKIGAQIKEQNRNEIHASTMGDYEAKNNSFIINHIPLPLRCLLLRCAYNIFGDCSTSITLSNLGKAEYPQEINSYINGVSFFLTPKKKSNYNCSIISFKDKLYISFSYRYIKAELAEIFFRKLTEFGITQYSESI
ncbi:MAG: hypothetical protein K2J83_00615 [Clostridia bacterium]|nr:hypothetical protein [Clostridia bacterium]